MATDVLLSDLPPQTLEADIRSAMFQFGGVYFVQMRESQNQAVVRFDGQEAATKVARLGRLQIGSKGVATATLVQQHQQQQHSATVAPQPPQQVQSAMAPAQTLVAPGLVGGYRTVSPPEHLRVTVTNVKHPVNQEVLQNVFRAAGIGFDQIHMYPTTGDGSVVGLVKLSDPRVLNDAIQRLSLQDIYPDCCKMLVEAAVIDHSLSPNSGAGGGISHQQQAYGMMQAQHHGGYHQQHGVNGGFPQHQQGMMYPNTNNTPYSSAQMQFAGGQYPNGGQGAMGYFPRGGQGALRGGAGFLRGGPGPYASGPAAFRGGRGAYMPQAYPPMMARGRGMDYGRGYAPPMHRGMGRGAGGFYPMGAQGYDAGLPSIVLVMGVPLEVPLQNLFALLEVYGNVLTMKRQHSSPKNVIVRFQNAVDAKGVAFYLSSAPFYGTEIRAKLFGGYVEKHAIINVPGMNPTDPAVQEYDFSIVHHRCNPHAASNTSRKFAPSENVFVTNLNVEISDKMLADAFTEKGHTPTDIYRKGPNSAIVSFASTEAAIDMIVKCHTFLLAGRYLKLMFSGQSPEQTRTITSQIAAGQKVNGAGTVETEGADEQPQQDDVALQEQIDAAARQGMIQVAPEVE